MNQRTLLVALVAVFALSLISAPSAEANCYYPHTTTIEYWMWVAKNDPNDHYCFNENGPIISPPIQNYYDWELVGEETWDCDNNYSSWGDLSCDEGLEFRMDWCPPICE